MSLGRIAASGTAHRRIRSFSVWVWIAGALVLSGVALNTYVDVGIDDNGFGLLSEDGDPWERADAPVFEPEGNVYTGTGGGLIQIPLDEHNEDPYGLRFITGGYLTLYVSPAEQVGRDDRERPIMIGSVYSEGEETLIIPPADADLEVWIRSDDEWEFELSKVDVDEITDGFVSGKGNAFLVYRGDAVSARFKHKGDGVFFVSLTTAGERLDSSIIESGDVDQRMSWDPTELVYFTVESDDERSAWSIDIDELATDSPEPPATPPASPEPTEPASATEPESEPAAVRPVSSPRPTASVTPRGTPRR